MYTVMISTQSTCWNWLKGIDQLFLQLDLLFDQIKWVHEERRYARHFDKQSLCHVLLQPAKCRGKENTLLTEPVNVLEQ